MHVEERKLASGEVYFSFVYWDGEKRRRLKKGEHPNFSSIEKAKEWAKAKEAEVACMKARIIKRQEWKSQYYEFSKLSEEYIEHCKRTQPNSWQNSRFDLENYVMPFFLDVKKANNPNNWSLYFEDFKNWLVDSAVTVKKKSTPISYSTKNHCIKTLNTFLDYLRRRNLVDPANVYKVASFPAHLIGSRDADHLISEDEFNCVHKVLKEMNPQVATFFETAYWTGMRFNEIFGLSLDDLYIGELDDQVLRPALIKHDIKYFGYIILQSQPASKSRERLANGSIARKPLKGKPKIDTKHDRLIPIVGRELFNNLVRLYKIQEEKFKKRVYGTNPKDYVLFETLTYSKAVEDLRAAYGKTKYAPKSYHCCRHTRCTELVGQTRDFVLVRYWLGHARQETTFRYTHIYQRSARLAKKKVQIIDFL